MWINEEMIGTCPRCDTPVERWKQRIQDHLLASVTFCPRCFPALKAIVDGASLEASCPLVSSESQTSW